MWFQSPGQLRCAPNPRINFIGLFRILFLSHHFFLRTYSLQVNRDCCARKATTPRKEDKLVVGLTSCKVSFVLWFIINKLKRIMTGCFFFALCVFLGCHKLTFTWIGESSDSEGAFTLNFRENASDRTLWVCLQVCANKFLLISKFAGLIKSKKSCKLSKERCFWLYFWCWVLIPLWQPFQTNDARKILVIDLRLETFWSCPPSFFLLFPW